MVFNGDLDMACNHLGDMWFVEDLEQEMMEDGSYRPWFYTSPNGGSTQIAGYVSQYQNLTYNQVTHIVGNYGHAWNMQN